jgi:magnesium and cobalt transporter
MDRRIDPVKCDARTGLSATPGAGGVRPDGDRLFSPARHHAFARMSDPQPPPRQREPHPTLLARISALLMREPEDREQLLSMLHHAHERELLDADALSMIEGVMQVSELSARDIMVPRSQIDMIDIREKPEDLIPFVIETAHSRFPVIEEDRDHVIGILLAKDLLRYGSVNGSASEHFEIRRMLRPATFIPESKRLNVLLRDFRANRNHVAIVVDEYGGVAGLVTIEDVLEQIVGDIEDEYDFDEDDDNIVAIEAGPIGPRWRVRALTEIEQFNAYFETAFTNDQAETIGGVVTEHLGRVPRRGEEAIIANIRFTVLRADARRVDVLRVEKLPVDERNDDAG